MTLVRLIVTHPRIYRMASDDGSPAREDFEPAESDAIWYVLALDGDELLGCFVFSPSNAVSYEVHTCLLPEALTVSGRSISAARGVIQWMWDNSPCRRITTKVPLFNRLALRFAEAATMIRFGVDEMSFLKGGKLYGQVLLGISKPEVT